MRIVIDEAGDIPADLAEQYHIETVPINIMFGTEQYLSNVDIDNATFYEKAKQIEAHNFPKTSQPTPYQFIDCFNSILAEGEDEILIIVVGEKLSGTYASAIQAAKELEGKGIFHVFDSRAGSAVQGFMAIEAARMHNDGANIEAILAKLEQMRDNLVIFLTIDNFEFAVKSGRISFIRSMMASLLNIKPILSVEDGLFVEAGRVRTRRKALAHIVEMTRKQVGDRLTRLAVLHANAETEAHQLQRMTESVLRTKDAFLMDLSIAVAIHLGPGALGLIAIPY